MHLANDAFSSLHCTFNFKLKFIGRSVLLRPLTPLTPLPPNTHLIEPRGKEVACCEDATIGSQAVLLHHVLVVYLQEAQKWN